MLDFNLDTKLLRVPVVSIETLFIPCDSPNWCLKVLPFPYTGHRLRTIKIESVNLSQISLRRQSTT